MSCLGPRLRRVTGSTRRTKSPHQNDAQSDGGRARSRGLMSSWARHVAQSQPPMQHGQVPFCLQGRLARRPNTCRSTLSVHASEKCCGSSAGGSPTKRSRPHLGLVTKPHETTSRVSCASWARGDGLGWSARRWNRTTRDRKGLGAPGVPSPARSQSDTDPPEEGTASTRSTWGNPEGQLYRRHPPSTE